LFDFEETKNDENQFSLLFLDPKKWGAERKRKSYFFRNFELHNSGEFDTDCVKFFFSGNQLN